MDNEINLLNLPDIVLEKIFSFLTFDEIAKNRLVCKKFDVSCKSLLNRGFMMVERRQSLVSRTIKHCLPRRESERRAHPLARHCEILSALETRISMLSMTFMKFIEVGLCCFIPGKIIDEILYILRVVQGSNDPPRTHDLLQELRDISSMAMEHFEEHIAPNLRMSDASLNNYYQVHAHKIGIRRTRGRAINISDITADIIHKEFKTIEQQFCTRVYRQQLSGMKKMINKLVSKMNKQSNCITYQFAKLREQRRLIQKQNSSISDLKKHLQENDEKFEELTQMIESYQNKPKESRASQTNEKVLQTSKPEDSTQLISPEHLERLTSHFNLPSSVIATLNTIQKKEEDLHSSYTEDYEFFTRKVKESNRRSTISDFRIEDENHKEENAEANARKRKLIDLISNVVDSKLPKRNTDQSEITQFLKQFPKLNDSVERKHVSKKRRINFIADLGDEIPHKRLYGKFRPN